MPEGYQYKRALLKLSGEALAGAEGHGVDPEVL
ncbi:MAG: UMP kinase, partial [Eggerthellaceae bacterium]|nr:UMP kinase [Eggerthellaceae bacterium]